MCHLNGNEATTQDHQMLGEGIKPHDGVRRVERHLSQTRQIRSHRPSSSGDDDLVGRHAGSAYVDASVTGEPGVALVDGHVLKPDSVVASTDSDRVNSAKHAVTDGLPVGTLEGRMETE